MRPGLYAAQEVIETFPGDTVTVSGTVSNYMGLASVTLSCEAWGIEKVYDLAAQEPVVFNYNYRMVVPDDATFEEDLDIVVLDKNGLDNRKTVLLKYLPDMTAPTFTAAPASQAKKSRKSLRSPPTTCRTSTPWPTWQSPPDASTRP